MSSMNQAAVVPPMSVADRRAHELASYVRRAPLELATDEQDGTPKAPPRSRPRGQHPYSSAGVA